ncbi:nuclear transport factor 2-like [Musa acuminata AAA Group]|uniref:nuclear transport factor 2-like n=1 Tax=Musa acuminata AAA Group TaxID=214697 RepID=UPI0031D4C658
MLLATSLGVPEIKKVNSQESHHGGVLVHVTGRLTKEDNVKRDFSQSFFLAPQETGYFVLNDILQYVDEIDEHQGSGEIDERQRHQGSANEQEETVSVPIDVVVAPAKEICDSVSNDESSAVQEKEPGNEVCDSVNEGESSTVQEQEPGEEVCDSVSNGESSTVQGKEPSNEVSDSANNGESSTVQGKEPSNEVSDSANNGESSTVQGKEPSNEVSDSMNNGESSTVQEKQLDNEVSNVVSDSSHQQMPKRTYASVIKSAKDVPVNVATAEWVPVVAAPSKPVPAPTPEEPISSSVDERSICVKNIPLHATPALLEEQFKRFGPIKPGGSQVRGHHKWQESHSCFGFVEFQTSDSARRAIEASPIVMSGRSVKIEPKKILNPGVDRYGGRFPPGGVDGQQSGLRQHGNRGYVGGRAGNRTRLDTAGTGSGSHNKWN